MSLDYNLSEIKDWKTLSSVPDPNGPVGKIRLNPVTEYLIHMMMVCGIGSLSEKNVDEAIERIGVYQAIEGPALKFNNGGYVTVRANDVREHIGLRTNADRMSKHQFQRAVYNLAKATGDRAMARNENSSQYIREIFEAAAKRASASNVTPNGGSNVQ